MANRNGGKRNKYLVVSRRPDFSLAWKTLLDLRGEVYLADNFGLLSENAGQTFQLAVVDASLLDTSAEHAVEVPRAVAGGHKILLAGGSVEPQKELQWLAQGIVGCCDVALGRDALRRIVDVVSRGGIWVSTAALPLLIDRLQSYSDRVGGSMVRFGASDHLSQLTQREREVAELVASGSCNKDIARHLDISDRTVKAHLTAIFSKLGVTDRLQLALLINRR